MYYHHAIKAIISGNYPASNLYHRAKYVNTFSICHRFLNISVLLQLSQGDEWLPFVDFNIGLSAELEQFRITYNRIVRHERCEWFSIFANADTIQSLKPILYFGLHNLNYLGLKSLS